MIARDIPSPFPDEYVTHLREALEAGLTPPKVAAFVKLAVDLYTLVDHYDGEELVERTRGILRVQASKIKRY